MTRDLVTNTISPFDKGQLFVYEEGELFPEATVKKSLTARLWATQRLREYIVKGFVLNDERLKEPEGGRYFVALPARIPWEPI